MSDDTTPPDGGTPDPTPDPAAGASPGQPQEPPAPPTPPPYGSTTPPGDGPPPAYAPPAGAPYGGSGGSGYSPVEAISYGWGKFTKNPSALLVPTLIVAVVAIGVEIVLFFVLNATLLSNDCTVTSTDSGISFNDCNGPGLITRLFAYAILAFVVSLFMQALGAGLIKAGIDVADGKQVNAGQVFAYVTKPNVLITAALVALATAIGYMLCYIPGIIIAFLTVFSMFYVVDKNMEPVEAIKASVSLTTSKLGDTLLFYILGALVLIVGAILCVVGLLVAVPVVLAGAAYTYRLLNNEPVSPVDAR